MHCDPAMSAPLEPPRVSLALTREVACIRSLAWRCDLPAETDLAALAAELEAAGLTRQQTVRGLHRFVPPRQAETLVAQCRRRVHFCVHYRVPEPERPFAAERL